jgi:hypothetical protein
MGGPFRRIVALAAALTCAALLVACGGGGSDSTTSSTGGATEGGVASAEGPGGVETGGGNTTQSEDGEGSEGGTESGAGSGDSGSGSSPHGSAKSRAKLDLPKRGKVSQQSESFQQYSAPGKLHLAEFGHEAEGESRGEADEVALGYLEAAAHEEWANACGYLMEQIKAELTQLFAKSDPSAKDCPEQLAQMSKSQLWRKASDGSPISAPEGISSIRIKEGGLARGGAGFALFHGSDGEDHWLAMKVEGGEWKVLSTSPQPFQ